LLVHELIKGVMEVLGTQGLPDDPRQAEMVMDAEDTLTAEVWDLRLGPVIWEKFRAAYPQSIMGGDMDEVQNYLFSEFARMDSDLFFELAKKILSGNEEGQEELSRIVDGIIKELDDDGMSDEEDYEDDTPTVDIPRTRPTSEPAQDYDMDKILEKIFSDGMESLTKGEEDYLKSQSK